MVINYLRIVLTGIYLVAFYLLPIFVLPSFLPMERSLIKSYVDERQIGYVIDYLGGIIAFRGLELYFLTFQGAYGFCLIVSNKLVDVLTPI